MAYSVPGFKGREGSRGPHRPARASALSQLSGTLRLWGEGQFASPAGPLPFLNRSMASVVCILFLTQAQGPLARPSVRGAAHRRASGWDVDRENKQPVLPGSCLMKLSEESPREIEPEP